MPKIEKTVYETMDPGIYAGTIRSITATEGKFGPQLEWDINIVGSDYSQRTWTGAVLSDKSKLGKYVRNILGEIPEELDTDDLVGMAVRVNVIIKVQDDGTEVNRIDGILSAKSTSTRAKVKPIATLEEVEEVDELEPVAETETTASGLPF